MSSQLHVKRATCRVQAGQSRGTGALIAPGFVGTAHHVVRPLAVGKPVKLFFDDAGLQVTGEVYAADEANDVAVIKVVGEVAGVEPLGCDASALAVHQRWSSYGFPTSAAEVDEELREARAGVWLSGDVQDPSARHVRGGAAVMLYSREAAAGAGAALKGQSGAAAVNERFEVIGHLKNVLPNGDAVQPRAEMGLLYAAGVEHALSLLPAEVRPAARQGGEPGLKRWHAEAALRVSVIYASEDEEKLKTLEKFLVVLKRQHQIATWSSQGLAGSDLDNIAGSLDKSDIVLLFVSPDLFYSEACEALVEEAMRLQEAGRLWVVPVLLRPTPKLSEARFGRLQPVPKGPISKMDPDEAWSEVTDALRAVVKHLRERGGR
jgi:hypothetical protein